MEPEVIEFPPPIRQPSKLIEPKEAILHDVIDVDIDEDATDLVLIAEKVCRNKKGKAIKTIQDAYGDHQAMEVTDYVYGSPCMKFGPANEAEPSIGHSSVSHNSVNVDDQGSDLSDDADDCIDMFSEDYMDIDRYALLQAHFDNMDIPPGIEAPIPWFQDFDQTVNKSGSSSLFPWCPTESDIKNSHVAKLSQASWSSQPTHLESQGISVGSASLQTKMNPAHSSGTEFPSPELFSQGGLGKEKSAASQHSGSMWNMSLGLESSKPQWFLKPFHSKKKHAMSGASTYPGSVANNTEIMKLPSGSGPPYWKQHKSAKKVAIKGGLMNFGPAAHVDGLHHPPGIELTKPFWNESHNYKPLFVNHSDHSGFYGPFDPLYAPTDPVYGNSWVQNSAGYGNNGSTADSSIVTISDEDREEILRKFQHFKQFDTVEDVSDHHHIGNNSAMKQHSKDWAKRIQEEWKILKDDLPDSIFVRVYESRMDLLRAVIIGAEGTPYHDGLFFFDVFFPSDYPYVPPQVHYHSGGLRLNPNLYNCGKVCLSLLNTWSGDKNEKWIPGVSTILQVLVSIQGLILNTKPFFNEPGYAHMSGSVIGEMRSVQYNEEAFILSLRTMTYMMRRPPKNFEEFVAGHFCRQAHDILAACKAYINGAQVGCWVKHGVQGVAKGDQSMSKHLKESLAGCVNGLVREFTQIGAKDCDKFLCQQATTKNKPLTAMPEAAT